MPGVIGGSTMTNAKRKMMKMNDYELTPLSNVRFNGVVAEEINRLNKELKKVWFLLDRAVDLLQEQLKNKAMGQEHLDLLRDYTEAERA